MNLDELIEKLSKPTLRQAVAEICKMDFLSYLLVVFFLINSSKFLLKDFHRIIIRKLQDIVECKNDKRNLALCLPVGCLSGDTLIRYNRASLGRKMTLKDMYLKQNNLPGTRKWNLEIPTFVRSYIEKDKQIRLNKVDCITYSGKKMVYQLLLEDGKSLKATIEHKIMTDKGFVELGQLKIGDMVMVDNVVGKKKKEVSEATKQKNKESRKCVGKYHPYALESDDGYSWRIELHRAIYEAHLNNMSLENFCLACKSPNNLKFINPKTYHIHHIDGNHSNNAIENLQCLARAEHLKIHGNYNHFGYGNPEYSAVKSITRVGIEDTYDITCFDNPNFNANDIIVHNSGKSLIIEYFITWCFARSINNTFCYTSNSDRLINKLSKECKDIIENEHWQLLFNHPLKKDDRQRVNFSFEDAKNRTGLTAGTTGGAITGLDAGNPNIEGFSGALIIDDPLDAGNARYEKAREEVITFYDEKLATRRRTPTTPTILIMQRLHLDDLVGWIEKNEPDLWDICKVKALDDEGNSFWEERYPSNELKHIQLTNAFKFQSQYQQEPIALGGSVIKGEWFGYSSVNVKYDYKKIIIAADTAIQAKEHSDYSCFLVGGVTQNNHLHILQMAHDKWEYPELKQNASRIYNQWQLDKRETSASALYIEDKASGQQLIQDFKKLGLPVRPIEVTKDKLTRVEEVLDYIASGLVELPESRSYGNNNVLISECEAFSRDMSHSHDDIVDTLVHLINNSIAKREVSILEVL